MWRFNESKTVLDDENNPPVLVSAEELGAILDRNPVEFTVWEAEGCPHHKATKGARYHIADVVRWLEERGETRVRRARTDTDLAKMKTAEVNDEKAALEMEVKALRGFIDRLAPDADLVKVMTPTVGGWEYVAMQDGALVIPFARS